VSIKNAWSPPSLTTLTKSMTVPVFDPCRGTA
jgi:hypothetical protein